MQLFCVDVMLLCTSLVPRLSVQLFFARSKISGPLILLRAKISWTESLGTRLTQYYHESLLYTHIQMLKDVRSGRKVNMEDLPPQVPVQSQPSEKVSDVQSKQDCVRQNFA